MNEGWWINYQTSKTFRIHEHETWIREGNNAKKLGIPLTIIKSFAKFRPVKDRDKFLLFLLKQCPVMRVRGHGSYVTFEFSTRSRKAAVEEIWLWGQENAGPFTMMNIINFATGEQIQLPFRTVDEQMEKNGVEGVLRAASIQERFSIKPAIVRELVRISEELAEE